MLLDLQFQVTLQQNQMFIELNNGVNFILLCIECVHIAFQKRIGIF